MKRIRRIYPPKKSKKELRLIRKNPFGDKDKDKVMNFFDCKPLNKNWQDVILYHGTTKQAAEIIKREGLRLGHGINPVLYLTPKISTAIKYSPGGVVFKVKLPDEVVEKLGDRILVAHNSSFDVRILNAELERTKGIKMTNKSLCTVKLARKLLTGLTKFKLGAIADFFDIKIVNQHRALDDAYATAIIFLKLLERAKELEWRRLSQLEKVAGEPKTVSNQGI